MPSINSENVSLHAMFFAEHVVDQCSADFFSKFQPLLPPSVVMAVVKDAAIQRVTAQPELLLQPTPYPHIMLLPNHPESILTVEFKDHPQPS